MKLPFDQCFRRRVYLVRHGHALGTDAASAAYTDDITLTARGLAEARAMRDILRSVHFDRVISSDIGRALATAQILVEGRDLHIEQRADFRELRVDLRQAFTHSLPPDELLRKFAYCMFDQAGAPGGSFFGGEEYVAFFERVTQAFERLVSGDSEASTILLVSHSVVNRALLCWALGLGPGSMANLEQDTGCANMVDVDLDLGQLCITRKIIRLMNFTPGDCVKGSIRLLDSEESAPKVTALVAAHSG